MSREVKVLLAMVRDFQERVPLEEMLQGIVDRAAGLFATQRISLRLFDASRTRLIAQCRAGEPLHKNPATEFRPGEGLVGWIAQHGEPIRTGDADHDPRFAPRPDLKGPIGSYLGVPLVVDRVCIGVLSASDARPNRFTTEDEDLLCLVAGLCAPHIEVVRRTRLEQIDELTGAINRRGLDLAMPDLSLLSVVAIDVDGFARINQAHGRAVGDDMLKRIARILAGTLRGGDVLVRLEEDEFLFVLLATDAGRAAAVAEEARSRLRSSGLPAGNATIRVTISAGVAARLPDEAKEATVARARAALAAAKKAGRNRVETAP